MLARCLNPKSLGYRYYGAKGITVCDRWNPKTGGSFANFLADKGCRPKGTTIGRSLDTGDYTLVIALGRLARNRICTGCANGYSRS